jgi:hypothetical protein
MIVVIIIRISLENLCVVIRGPVPLLEANLNCRRKFSNLVPLLEGDLKNIIYLLKI